MSQTQLARASALSRKKVADFERGRSSASEAELHALAQACAIEVDALAPAPVRLSLAAHVLSDRGPTPVDGDAALNALLREYVAMLTELRGSADLTASSLREDDIDNLAQLVGDRPEAIEARLTALLESVAGDANLRP